MSSSLVHIMSGCKGEAGYVMHHEGSIWSLIESYKEFFAGTFWIKILASQIEGAKEREKDSVGEARQADEKI